MYMHQEQANNETETITNLDFLFQKDGNECKHAIIASNDIDDSEVYDDDDDDVDEYEMAEELLREILEGQQRVFEESPLGFVHSRISMQEDHVNREIIDMLLQWEERVNQNHQLDSNDNESGKSSAAVPTKMLQRLNLLDTTMCKIEDWLGSRLEDLVDVTDELASIEKERKRIEINMKNLTTLSTDITGLIEDCCLTQEEETLIQTAPSVVIDALNCSFDDINKQLHPLISALERLVYIRNKHQHDQNGGNDEKEGMLRSLGGVSLMLQSIARISVDYVRHMDPIFTMSIFGTILNHGDLTLKHTLKLPPLHVDRIIVIDILISHNSAPNTNVHAGDDKEKLKLINPLQITQQTVHEVIMNIIPLVEVTIKISPSLLDRLQRDYIRSVREQYKHMLKQTLKEIRALGKGDKKAVTLATSKDFVLGAPEHNRPTITFTATSTRTSMVTPWTQLELFLTLTLPFVEREVSFFKSIFSSDLQSLGADETCPGYESCMDFLCSGVTKGIKALINDMAEGVDSLGQYTVLDSFCSRMGIDIENEMKNQSSSCPACCQWYLEHVIYQCKYLLRKRVDYVLNAQLQWLKHRRANPKQADVTAPFMKYPSLITNYLEVFTTSTEYSFIDQFYKQLTTSLIDWLETNVIAQNQKYTDVLRIINFSYLSDAVSEIKLRRSIPPSIDTCLLFMSERIGESRISYVKWMIWYEFPLLTSINDRFGNSLMSDKVNLCDLSLFVTRNEVASLGNSSNGELTSKSVRSKVTCMKKRFQKHFNSTLNTSDNYISIWRMIKEKFLVILQRIHESSTVSYQLSFQSAMDAAVISFGIDL